MSIDPDHSVSPTSIDETMSPTTTCNSSSEPTMSTTSTTPRPPRSCQFTFLLFALWSTFTLPPSCSVCTCLLCRGHDCVSCGGRDRGINSRHMYTHLHCTSCMESYQEIKYVHTYICTLSNFTRCVIFVTGGVCSLLPVSLPVILHDRMLTTCTIIMLDWLPWRCWTESF